ncbi:MAG: CapA family protein, partial [Gemmatimonadaceae bacterium]
PGFADAIKLLQGSSAAFANFESTAFDVRNFTGHADAENGGLWLRTAPDVLPDVRKMGINLVARANNHATDWGYEGMRETDRLLDDAEIVHAGTGETRALARAARYLATPQGRVALVSMTSTFTPSSRSMDALNQTLARPGVSAVRLRERIMVSPQMLRSLRQFHAAQPLGAVDAPADTTSTELTLFGTSYRASPAIKDRMAYSYGVDSTDVKEIMAAVRQGKSNADFLVATIHAHEPGNWSEPPADFLPGLAHAAIDNGADAFVGHGPHRLRGIEIYRGRPIFYSLGNFFFQIASHEPIPQDLYEEMGKDPRTTSDAELHGWFERNFFRGANGPTWYRSVIAVCRYEGGSVSEIRLYPLELGYGEEGITRGVPRLATPEISRQILETLARLSTPYGTTITVEGSVGIIRPQIR